MTSTVIMRILAITLMVQPARAMAQNGRASDIRPNIILIMADDMGYADLGCMGAEIQTPNLDALAGKGLLLTNFYNTGRCCPTRASLMTGLYSHQAGVGDMDSDDGIESYSGHLLPTSVTIAEALQQAGYDTYFSGKWHLGNKEEYHPYNRGFQQYFLVKGGGGIYFYPPLIDRTVWYNGRQLQPDSSFYSTDAINDYAAGFIEAHQQSDKPFFLYVPHIAPHHPLQAKQQDIAKYRGLYKKGWPLLRKKRYEAMLRLGILDRCAKLSPPDNKIAEWNFLSEETKDSLDLEMAVYAAQVDCMDQGIGRIIKKLKQTNQWNNTVIFFLSDNGGQGNGISSLPNAHGPVGSRNCWQIYDRGWANMSNTPFRLYKEFSHEGGIATPLIVHYPEKIRQHRLDRTVGHVMDILPTCLALAGATYPSVFNGNKITPVQGISLLPALLNKTAPTHTYVAWEHEGNRAVRQGAWKLVSYFPKNEWELYNIKNDRSELNNLAKQMPQKVAALQALYNQWSQQVGVVPRQQLLLIRKQKVNKVK